jgi:hypothetical protein
MCASRLSQPWPIVALAGCILDGVCVAQVVQFWEGGPITFRADPYLLHAAAALLTGFAFPGWRPRSGDIRHAMGPLVCVISFCFPVLGAMTCTLVALARRSGQSIEMRLLRQYQELADSPHPATELPAEAAEHLRIRSWQALEMRPFRQLLASAESSDVTASAIESVQMLERNVASRLLKHALASGIPQTRYYASKALARLEDDLDRELREATAELVKHPDDAMVQVRVATTRLHYSELGDVEDPVTRFHLSEAIRLYKACVPSLPQAERYLQLARLGHASLRMGNPGDAVECFAVLAERRVATIASFKEAFEASYLLRDYARLAWFVQRAKVQFPESDTVEQIERSFLGEPVLKNHS